MGGLVTSCTSLHPTYYNVSKEDYNTRVKVSDPGYHKKINGVGVGAILATTAGGAYLGYQNELIAVSDANHSVKSDKYINAAIGGLVGFGVSSLANYLIAGQGKRVSFKGTKDDMNRWVSKYDNNYTGLRITNGDIIMIADAADEDYTVDNWSDIEDFYSVFDDSQYKTDVFDQGVEVLDRRYMPDLIDKFPSCKYVPDAKFVYYDLSENLEQLFEAERRFPNRKYEVEEKAVKLTRSYSDARKFFDKYPSSKFNKYVYINSLASSYTKNEAKAIKKKLGSTYYLTQNDLKKKKDRHFQNYSRALIATENPTSLQTAFNLFNDYKWLNYNNRTDDVLGLIWKIAYDDYKDGDQLIRDLTNISNDKRYSFLGINNAKFPSFIRKKLQSELQKNVEVVEESVTDSRTYGHFDDYGGLYDALFVTEEGEIQYLYYGYLKNDSKFSLPIKYAASAKVISETEGGFFGWNFMTMKEVKDVLSGSYIIPNLKSGDTTPFAMLFKLKGITGAGINFIVSAKTKDVIGDFQGSIKIFEGKINDDQINRQKAAMTVAEEGFKTTSKLYDGILFREEYDPLTYTLPSLSGSGSGNGYYSGSGDEVISCGNDCKSFASVYVDVSNELFEGEKRINVSCHNGSSSWDPSDSGWFRDGGETDSGTISDYKCIAGKYTISYSWDLDNSDADSSTQTFTTDGTCSSIHITLSKEFFGDGYEMYISGSN